MTARHTDGLNLYDSMSGRGESAYRVPVLIAAVKEVPDGLPTRVHRRRRVDQSRGPGDEAAFVLGAGAARGTARAGALLLLAERFDVRAVAESGHALPRPLHGTGRTAASTELSCKVYKCTGRLALEMCVCARARARVCASPPCGAHGAVRSAPQRSARHEIPDHTGAHPELVRS